MDDLVSEFITETAESLSVLDLELVKLEQNPNDQEILSNIFRLVHTIKGTCGFLGLPRLESVAHAGENVLGKIRDGELEVTETAISLVLEALDTIKEIMDYLADNGEEPEGDDSDLINRLNAFADGGGAVAEAPAEETPAEEAEAPKMPDVEPDEHGFVPVPAVAMDWSSEAPTEAPAEEAAAPEEEPKAEEAPKPAAAPPAPKPAAPKAAQKDKAIAKGLEEEKKESASSGLANQSIRVNLDVLESLMQMVGELVLTRNQLMMLVRNSDSKSEAVEEFKGPLQHLSYITTELQEGVMKTRMQPIGNAWSKFPRLIRDLSNDLGKKIELRMVGAETELDRQLLEMIKDPLTHMVRNSCDHGLEPPAERQENGKGETGTVTLSAYHEGGHILIEIADDGRGVPVSKIKGKIIEKGFASEEEADAMSDQQIIQHIFKAGFSTAEQVTSVSGRGVGMDVVRTNIEKIGGTVELTSEEGRGSKFHIKIPLTLAIVSVLIVKSEDQNFAIPQINVTELVRIGDDSEYQIEEINDSKVLRLRDKLLPLATLSRVLGIGGAEPELNEDGQMPEQFVVVCKIGETDFGLIVDEIFDTEEIVVKPVSELLQSIEVFSGNTILGDGSVIMILDPNGVARQVGKLEAGAKDAADELVADAAGEKRVSFLLFSTGEGAPKAVPLELVSRLEEVDASKIELSGEKPVIQYRGDLMRLLDLHGKPLPTEGMQEVIVFTYDGRTIGLLVEQIIDIVVAPLAVKMASNQESYLGSMVIQDKTTDVVDVGYLLRDMVDMDSLNILKDKRIEDMKLLLVEDSMFFRKLTVPLLKKVGYQVVAAEHGPEALEILYSGKHKFDAIVTDIEMPEMDGFELTKRIRSDARFDGVPILAFTSTVNQEFSERGKKCGMVDMILKTDREALINAVAEQLLITQQEGGEDVA